MKHRVLGHRGPRRLVHDGLRGLPDDGSAGDEPGERRVYLRATTVLTPYVFATERPAPAPPRGARDAGRVPRAGRVRTPPRADARPARRSVGHYPVHVRFSDVDAYGHVNNVKYFEYFQEARILLTRAAVAGPPRGDAAESASWSRATDVDYRAPILFRAEPYDSWSWVSRVGDRSMTVESEIRDGERVLSRARVVMVFFDQETAAAGERRRRACATASRAARRELAEASLQRVDHELGGVGRRSPRTGRPARECSVDLVERRRGSARSQRSLASGVTANGACRIRSRGWPRVLGVRRRAAPVLHQEQREAAPRPARGPPRGRAAAAPRPRRRPRRSGATIAPDRLAAADLVVERGHGSIVPIAGSDRPTSAWKTRANDPFRRRSDAHGHHPHRTDPLGRQPLRGRRTG